MPPEAQPVFESAGNAKSTIDVRISNRIVELFSEGLYSSPNKAIEELVSNSFDAGARNVQVLLDPDLGAEGATITVIDDGTGMDEEGLRQHWIIGVSSKRRKGTNAPLGRKPIGKFGIGKLATYVLANKLTHITKVNGHFFAVTMDYTQVHSAEAEEVFSDAKVQLPLRELTESEAQHAVAPWISGTRPGFQALKLFGAGASKSWTVAILSNLKDLAADLKMGQLRWVLRTAMPLRDDFHLYLDGETILPSKMQNKQIKRWILGKDITELPKVEDLQVTEDRQAGADSPFRFGLTHPKLGRITGYAELYEDLLTTGKSAGIERSHGFFVYVRDRLVNLTDEYFGIDRNLLRHGTFSRFRMVVYIDRLDEELRSSRETIREGALTEIARDILRGVFNLARLKLEAHEASQQAGAKLSTRIADTPASLTRQPIIGLLTSAFEKRISPRYTTYPTYVAPAEKEDFLQIVRERAESETGLVTGVERVDLSQDLGIALYNSQTGILQINTLHPFVAYFLDEFEDGRRNLPLELMAMSEVLTEAHLYQIMPNEALVRDVMNRRDSLLRYLARSTGKRNAFMIARDLQDASSNKGQLEIELVAAFNSLGFDAIPLGGPGKPDGVATASLSASTDGKARMYKVSLEAKSKEKEGTKVSAKSVGIAGIARQRGDYGCDHAVVVGPDFPTTLGEASVLLQEIDADREHTGKTISLIRIVDFARLVKIVPLKRINLDDLRDLFWKCRTPEESKLFIEGLANRIVKQPPHKEILETVWELQKEVPGEAVEYSAITTALRINKKITMTKGDLIEVCKALAQMAIGYVFAQANSVELSQRPEIVLKAIGSTLQLYEEDAAYLRHKGQDETTIT
jgi:hypothetical protein